jgi:hypothetical protein
MTRILMASLLMLGNALLAQSWLHLPASTGYVQIGDLDIAGTALTIEANYTSTNAASVDLVSKHSGFADVNYLLRRTHAELTTSGGFFSTPQVCTPDENTCRHAAMVYDGSTLSFYLNGQLNGQVAQTGTLVNNNFQTLIGNYGCCFGGEQFFGFLDEVRIWDVARSQADIQNFMFAPLPTPSLQPGLRAYYQFSSLVNQQGDPTWDGIAAGTAVIGQANPFCGALSPVCAVLTPGFERFLFQMLDGGLDFDWHWAGAMPSAFELHTGPRSDALHATLRLDPAQSAYRWAGLPRVQTWFQLVAIDADGQRTASNIVAFHPQDQHLMVSQGRDRHHVRIEGPPGRVDCQLIDGLGRVMHVEALQTFGGSAEIALPEGLHGSFVLVAHNGRERALHRVWRTE